MPVIAKQSQNGYLLENVNEKSGRDVVGRKHPSQATVQCPGLLDSSYAY